MIVGFNYKANIYQEFKFLKSEIPNCYFFKMNCNRIKKISNLCNKSIIAATYKVTN